MCAPHVEGTAVLGSLDMVCIYSKFLQPSDNALITGTKGVGALQAVLSPAAVTYLKDQEAYPTFSPVVPNILS